MKTRTRQILESLPDQEDGGAYYCDIGADWNHLKRMQKEGLADTKNESDWWRTPAGRAAIGL